MIHKSISLPMSKVLGAPEKQGDIGVELEIEGRNLPAAGLPGWTVKAEGSLRGANGRVVQGEADDTPREYVSARPVALNTLLTRLVELNTALTTPPVVVNLSYRASTHIHINMGSERLSSFLAFCALFTVVEPVLLRLCGPERNGNSFCMPFYETGDAAETMTGLVNYILGSGGYGWRGRGKYASLNMDAITAYGSVEVRCFPNTIDPAMIHQWASWLMTIRSLARDVTAATGDFGAAIDEILADPRSFLNTVFGRAMYPTLVTACAPQPPEKLIEFGTETAYEMWKASRPLYNYSEKEARKIKNPAKTYARPPRRIPNPVPRYHDWLHRPIEPVAAPAVPRDPEEL